MVKAKNMPQAPSLAPSNYKTVMCRFFEKGLELFHFFKKESLISSLNEWMESGFLEISSFFWTGECGKGEKCTYAHFPEELRAQGNNYPKQYASKEPSGPREPMRPSQSPQTQSFRGPEPNMEMIRQETTVRQLKFLAEMLIEFYKDDKKHEKRLEMAMEAISQKETEKAANILEVWLSISKDVRLAE